MFGKKQQKGVQTMTDFSREYDILVDTDTHFKEFVERNKGKSILEICEEYDINLDVLIGNQDITI